MTRVVTLKVSYDDNGRDCECRKESDTSKWRHEPVKGSNGRGCGLFMDRSINHLFEVTRAIVIPKNSASIAAVAQPCYAIRTRKSIKLQVHTTTAKDGFLPFVINEGWDVIITIQFIIFPSVSRFTLLWKK